MSADRSVTVFKRFLAPFTGHTARAGVIQASDPAVRARVALSEISETDLAAIAAWRGVCEPTLDGLVSEFVRILFASPDSGVTRASQPDPAELRDAVRQFLSSLVQGRVDTHYVELRVWLCRAGGWSEADVGWLEASYLWIRGLLLEAMQKAGARERELELFDAAMGRLAQLDLGIIHDAFVPADARAVGPHAARPREAPQRPRVVGRNAATVAGGIALAAAAALSPVAARAQSDARPSYRPMRFEEQWLARPGSAPDWADPLKFNDFGSDGRVRLTLGGQWRGRDEVSKHYQLGTSPSSSDTYSQWRTVVGADLAISAGARLPSLRVFGEWRNAHSLGRDLPGGTRPQDEDYWDAQNAFADVAWHGVTLRGGLQEFAIGKERFVGLSDWSNARRGYDGVRAIIDRGAVVVDAFSGRPQAIISHSPNRPDSTTRFHAVSIGSPSAQWAAGFGWQAYWLLQEVASGTRAERRVYGGRLQWKPLTRALGLNWTLEGEGGAQRGSVGTRELAAWYGVAEVTARAPSVRTSPTLTIGADAASGDHNPADGRVETFQVLYPSVHTYGGYADLVGRANVQTVRVTLTSDPRPWLQLRADGYDWNRLNTADGVYTKAGALLRAASGSLQRHVGDEADLTATVAIGRHARISVGGARVFPGAFLRVTPGGAPVVDWAFIGTSYTW
jgi:hypothetical protein